MWRLVSDSSCDLYALPQSSDQIDFITIPFHIHIDGTDYIDDENMNVPDMLTANEKSAEAASTACPGAQEWADAFAGTDPVIAFTISSNLSGSYNSACAAREMILEEQPERQIAVIDTKATGPETVLIIRKACEMIENGSAFDEIVDALNETAARTHIIFSLSSYHNLIKAGRVNRLVALVAGHLGFWGIGVGSDEGRIVMRGKARGEKNMIRFLVNEIRQTGLAEKAVVISHCLNEKAADMLREALLNVFGNIRIDILPTRGLDSFYAERNGLIVGY